MATMKDVAKLAGVSLGTVSSVLQGTKTVKQDNIDKVMAAVNELDYKVNYMARALKSGRTNTLGLLIPDITNPYYPELARGAEDAALAQGYNLMLCNSDRDSKKELSYLYTLVQQGVSGCILAKPLNEPHLLEDIQKEIPLVLIDTDYDSSKFNIINSDEKLGAKMAIEYLIDKDHKKIGFVGGDKVSFSSKSRYETYCQVLQEHSIEIDPKIVSISGFTWQAGQAAFKKIYSITKTLPTAFFCISDIVAFGVIKAIHEVGLRVPEDISVVGFDNISQTEINSPALTTIHLPKYEIGQKSVDIIAQNIKSTKNIKGNTYKLFIPELVCRDSVKQA